MVLQDIRERKKYKYVAEEVAAGGGYKVKRYRRQGEPIDKPRGFNLQGDFIITWYWIDLETEWP